MIRIVLTVLIVVLVAVAGFALWVRMAPSEPERWHVDPAEARPGKGRFIVAPGGDMPPRLYPGRDPGEVLSRLDAIALSEPRTERLSGAPGEGRITWVQRSRLWGFPDYITADAQPAPGGGTRLEMLSRLRFGSDDMGVNGARVKRWLQRLEADTAL
ncbi:MAG: DUF1499 domain-containing protein [Celeribacter sp.]|jgi:uncharacterized protein (DUF1499 family)